MCTILLEQLRHTKFLLLVRWSVIPEHFLWTHRSHEVPKMELTPTPKVHTPQGYFGFLAENLVCFAVGTRILVLLIITSKPHDSSEVFQAGILSLRSARESLKIARSSAYSNSHGQLTLNSLDKASITIMNSKGLSIDPWSTPTDTLKGSLEEPFTCTLDWALLYIALTKWITLSSTSSSLKLHQRNSAKGILKVYKSSIHSLSLQVMFLQQLSENKNLISDTSTRHEPKLHAVNIYMLSNNGINNVFQDFHYMF